MNDYLIPEPYIAAGYTGHVPAERYDFGNTFGKATHKLFINPCTIHSPDLIVTSRYIVPKSESNPTSNDVKLLQNRENYVDAVYKHPIVAGYSGFIPKSSTKLGERFIAAATLGVVQHQAEIDRLHCERDCLMHSDLLRSGQGKFDTTLGERLRPLTNHSGPLIPVRRRAETVKIANCDVEEDKLPYSKFTTPHFMDYDNKEKFIKFGYDGHIPLMQKRYGSYKMKLTTDALSEFLKRTRNHSRQKWCPRDNAADLCPKEKYGGDSRDCPDCDYTIYRTKCGMIPLYGGHVPGEMYTFGKVYGKTTYNAKGYLEQYRQKGDVLDDWECFCVKRDNPGKQFSQISNFKSTN